MLKGQDMVVLAAIMDEDRQRETYAELGKRACLSASETHASIKRLQQAALVDSSLRVLKRNAMEFLTHGLRYAFPFRQSGKMAKGLATSYAAPIAEGVFASTGASPIWIVQGGDTYGQAFEPLYVTAPEAAVNDRHLYDRLAVFDLLRGGRLRERQYGANKLKEMLGF